MEVHMPVQAGAKAVDKSHCANMQGRPVHLGRPGDVGLQALRNEPQEDAQHCAVDFPRFRIHISTSSYRPDVTVVNWPDSRQW